MRKFLKAVFTSLDERQRRLEEEYLNASDSLTDLEWRQRQIDRGRFQPSRLY